MIQIGLNCTVSFPPDAENPDGVDFHCHKMNGEWKRKYLKDACYLPKNAGHKLLQEATAIV